MLAVPTETGHPVCSPLHCGRRFGDCTENEDGSNGRDAAGPGTAESARRGKAELAGAPPAYTNAGFVGDPPPYSLTARKSPTPPPPFYPGPGGPSGEHGYAAFPPGLYPGPYPVPPPGVGVGYPIQQQPYPAFAPGQTVLDLTTQVQAPPKDYLLESILVTLFCCLCTGFCAIVTSNKTRNAFHRGDLLAAQESSRRTRALVLFSLSFGLCLCICWLAFVIVQLYM
ncbi:proline rich transmembrane protein 1B-like isoform X2 [Petromyzon marinus]|uniref:Proline rich transmembrane protein 1B-like isoform X2 n=1 Tax=Petromyzon marinus TaxID=7757 RepID=A0AAJ7XCB6_PETMA|nr:proline rich transmembrane protein 1B-like isoform X2 [Petromyzon marinus]